MENIYSSDTLNKKIEVFIFSLEQNKKGILIYFVIKFFLIIIHFKYNISFIIVTNTNKAIYI